MIPKETLCPESAKFLLRSSTNADARLLLSRRARTNPAIGECSGSRPADCCNAGGRGSLRIRMRPLVLDQTRSGNPTDGAREPGRINDAMRRSDAQPPDWPEPDPSLSQRARTVGDRVLLLTAELGSALISPVFARAEVSGLA